MKDKMKWQEPRNSIYESVQREEFTVDDTVLIVEDRLNTYVPWRSERILWIAGTDAFYSVAPICPAWHRLLCFTYCKDVMGLRDPEFYQHALALGCGGGAVPRWLLEEYPSLMVDVVDRSPEIIDVCKKYFLNEWEDSDRLHYYCTDAQDFEAPKYKYEFIFCDLFNGEKLPSLVYTRSFAEKLRGLLYDEGILVINCGWQPINDVIDAYRGVFECIRVLDREPWQTQVLMLGSRSFEVI